MDKAVPRIYVLDDDAAGRTALVELLETQGYEVIGVADGRSGLAQMEHAPPDLVITDLEMPWLDGYGVIRELRQSAHKDVPVIVLSAHDETARRVEGFTLGADDFVPKPLDFDEFVCRVQVQLDRAAKRRAMARDSVSDPLTGMLNRRGVDNFVRRAREVREPREQIGVLLVDVDKFKAINDRYGHAVGDLALCTVANTLQDVVRASDRVGRIGGDEFVALLPGADDRVMAEVTRRAQATLPLEINLTNFDTVRFTFSLGSAVALPGEDLSAVLQRADEAMYANKRAHSARST